MIIGMKHYMLVASLLAMPFVTKAQSAAPQAGENYSRMNLSFVSMQPVYSGHGVSAMSSHSLYGAGISYLYGINVTGHRMPLFVEVGPECSFARRSEEIDYWDGSTMTMHDEIDTRILTLGTPINLSYQYRLSDNVMVAPSAGLNAKVNLMAKTRSKGATIDLFDMDAHRFQLGWNAGCGIYLDRLYLGLSYTADITPFISQSKEEESFHDIKVSLGLRF